jgi:ATP-binding cassette subfamily F protein 3
METAEAAAARLQAEIAALDARLGDPGLYAREPAEAQALAIERGRLVRRLAEAEEHWLAATAAYEEAAGGSPSPLVGEGRAGGEP